MEVKSTASSGVGTKTAPENNEIDSFLNVSLTCNVDFVNSFHWAKIYGTITASNRCSNVHIIHDLLCNVKTAFLKGLLFYECFDEDSYSEWAKVSKEKLDETLIRFMKTLALHLNLCVKQTWSIFSNYTMFDFYGKLSSMIGLIKNQSTDVLLDSIYLFYMSERVYLLKIIHYVLLNGFDEGGINQEDCNNDGSCHKFMANLEIDQMQTHFVEYLSLSVEMMQSIDGGVTDRKRNNNLSIQDKRNITCNLHEQNSVIVALLMTAKYKSFKIEHIQNIAEYCCSTNFSAGVSAFNKDGAAHVVENHFNLMALKACLFILAFQDFWHDKKLTWQLVAKRTREQLSRVHWDGGPKFVLFFWATLDTKRYVMNQGDNKSDDTETQKSELMSRIAVEMEDKSLTLMKQLLNAPVFRVPVVRDCVHLAMWPMCETLFHLFDATFLYECKPLILLIAQIMRTEEIANALCVLRTGELERAFRLTLETFPLDFYSLSHMLSSIMKHSSMDAFVKNLLTGLPVFLSDMRWPELTNYVKTLETAERAVPSSPLIILPAGTICRSYRSGEEIYLQYILKPPKYTYSNCLLMLLASNSKAIVSSDPRIHCGIRVIIKSVKKLLTCTELNDLNVEELFRKLEACFLSFTCQMLPQELVVLYLELLYCVDRYRGTNIHNLMSLDMAKLVFPSVNYTSKSVNIFVGADHFLTFQPNGLYQRLEQEKNTNDHRLALLYAKLANCIAPRLCPPDDDRLKNDKMSSVVFVITNIFVKHMQWRYADQRQRIQITHECVQLLHYYVQLDKSPLSADDCMLKEFCINTVSDSSHSCRLFMNLMVMSKMDMVQFLQEECDWNRSNIRLQFEYIRTALSTVLMMFQDKHYKKLGIDLYVVMSPYLRGLTYYITNNFDSVIGELACRILVHFAQGQENYLLSQLNYDADEVQTIFLERLRDPTVCMSFKLAIIELVRACVCNQSGMTAAFFNLDMLPSKESSTLNGGKEMDKLPYDSVTNFIMEFVEFLSKNVSHSLSPIHTSMLCLMADIWNVNHKKILAEITKSDQFWSMFLSPLFGFLNQSRQFYGIILRIATQHLLRSLPDKRQSRLEKLLVCHLFSRSDVMNRWLDFVQDACTAYDEKTDSSDNSLTFIQIWMNYILTVNSVLPNAMPNGIKTTILERTIDSMKITPSNSSALVVPFTWSKFYLVLGRSWKDIRTEFERTALTNITDIVQSISASGIYQTMTIEFRSVLVNMMVNTLGSCSDLQWLSSNETNKIQLQILLDRITQLIVIEFDNLQATALTEEEACLWIQIVDIADVMMSSFATEDSTNIEFPYPLVIDCVVKSLPLLLAHQNMLPYIKFVLQFMVSLTGNIKLADHLQSICMQRIHCQMKLPPLTMCLDRVHEAGFDCTRKEWWLIMLLITRYHHRMLHLFGKTFLNKVLDFLAFHNVPVCNILHHLTLCTLDSVALALVLEMVKLLNVLVQFGSDWRFIQQHQFLEVYDGMIITLNACGNVLQNWCKISIFDVNRAGRFRELSLTTQRAYPIIQKVIEITFFTCKFFVGLKSPLSTLLCAPTEQDLKQLIIKTDFAQPIYTTNKTKELTYGKLLGLAQFLCEILTSMSKSEETDESKCDSKANESSIEDEEESARPGCRWNAFYTHDPEMRQTAYLTTNSIHEERTTDDTASFKRSLALRLLEDSRSWRDKSAGAIGKAVLSKVDRKIVSSTLEVVMTLLVGEVCIHMHSMHSHKLLTFGQQINANLQFFIKFAVDRTRSYLPTNERNLSMYRSSVAKNASFKRYKPLIDSLFAEHYIKFCYQSDMSSTLVSDNFVFVLWQCIASALSIGEQRLIVAQEIDSCTLATNNTF